MKRAKGEMKVAKVVVEEYTRTQEGWVYCPWCKKPCDAGFRCPVVAKPCLHVGCMECLRKALAPVSMYERKVATCAVCKGLLKTFTIEGAPVAFELPPSLAAAAKEKEEDDAVATAPKQTKKKQKGKMNGKELDALLRELNAVKQERDELMQKETSENKRVADVARMEADELQVLEGTEPDETWSCIVCSYNYDNESRLPMCVSACHAIPCDPHMPKQDRGLAPGCGHTTCQPCMMTLLVKEDPQCYVCRSYIKDFCVNTPLLRTIASFKDGYYLYLVRQRNAAEKAQHAMIEDVRKLKEEYKGFDELKAKAAKCEKDLESTKSSLTVATGQRDKYLAELGAAKGRLNSLDQTCAKATERLRATMAINKMLFDEVIALRLHAIESGLLARSELGIEYSEAARRDAEKVVLKVWTKDRKSAMYYGRRRKDLSPEEMGSISRIEEHNVDMDDGAYARLPTFEELNGSYTCLANGQSVVQLGSWMHERIMSKVNTVEATFDAPPLDDEGGEGNTNVKDLTGKMYCVVSDASIKAALAAYERASAEWAEIQRAREAGKEKDKDEEAVVVRSKPPVWMDRKKKTDLKKLYSAPKDHTLKPLPGIAPEREFPCAQSDIAETAPEWLKQFVRNNRPLPPNVPWATRYAGGGALPPVPEKTYYYPGGQEAVDRLNQRRRDEDEAMVEAGNYAEEHLPSHASAATPEEVERARARATVRGVGADVIVPEEAVTVGRDGFVGLIGPVPNYQPVCVRVPGPFRNDQAGEVVVPFPEGVGMPSYQPQALVAALQSGAEAGMQRSRARQFAQTVVGRGINPDNVLVFPPPPPPPQRRRSDGDNEQDRVPESMFDM